MWKIYVLGTFRRHEFRTYKEAIIFAQELEFGGNDIAVLSPDDSVVYSSKPLFG